VGHLTPPIRRNSSSELADADGLRRRFWRHEVTRRPFMVPPSLLHPGAPPQVLGSSYFAAKRRNHRRPKITSAQSSSSRSSATVLDSPDPVEHTIQLPSPCHSSSTPSWCQKPPEHRRCPHLHRDLIASDENPSHSEHLLSLLCKPSDLKWTHKIRSLKNDWVSDLGRSDPFKSNGQRCRSDRRGTLQSGTATCRLPV
jgi:hypothetical protein